MSSEDEGDCMQALILAAGMGKRLKKLTRDNTKCMVKVNGITLIERCLRQLDALKLSRIIIVVGYHGDKLIDFISTIDIKTPVEYVENPVYNKTNNIYSLALAKDYLLEDDTLLLESDLIFEDGILDDLVNDPRDTLVLVDKYEAWMDGTCLTLSSDDTIARFVPKKEFRYEEAGNYYKTVNIYKFSRSFSMSRYVPFLDAYQKALGENEYYEQVLKVISILDEPGIKAKRLHGQLWYEIDDIQDLDIATSMFTPDEDKRVDLLLERYGGYWRYPQMLDFCYLVNPFFPPRRLKDEMKASFETLLTQYPSGMKVNSLLAAKNFSVSPENIVVGNGAAELIKSLMAGINGIIGIVRPTFEEYSHRYSEDHVEVFWPENNDYQYNADELIAYFSDKGISTLILINPDNPSGNFIDYDGIMRLIEWSANCGIRLIVDESFVDFADRSYTLIDQNLLEKHQNLVVMKSISKSYGVPGLRLGVLASGDKTLIAGMKKDVSIWNINSFAEFYLQIAEKYEGDYKKALELFRIERNRFCARLKKIDGLRVIPSQANYVMAEILAPISAKELNRMLIVSHNILIKNLVAKLRQDGRQYVRLAIRTQEDNDKLVDALDVIFRGISK